jgi:hypothetical protein
MSGETKTSSSRSKGGAPNSGTMQPPSNVAARTVVSIGTPLLIGAALRAVRREASAAVIDAHLRGLRAIGADDDLSVALVVQWLEERQRSAEPRDRTARAKLHRARTKAPAGPREGGDA